MTREEVMSTPIKELITSTGHHRHFTEEESLAELFRGYRRKIRDCGLDAFLREEYPNTADKNIIVNVVGDKCCIIDGNKHMVTILLSCPVVRDFTVGQLDSMRPGLFRIWFGGIEGYNNEPYDVYIPMDIDTDKIPETRVTVDYFQPGHPLTKVIPANISFDDERFGERDRGRPIMETVEALDRILEV